MEIWKCGIGNMQTWKWEFGKIRTDKKIANHLFTAEQIYMNFYNPLTIEALFGANNDINEHYFKTSDTSVIYDWKQWNNKWS